MPIDWIGGKEMGDIIYIIVLFVLPIITFINLYMALWFNKNKNLHKKFILTNVALIIYLLGMLTPISLTVCIVIVYLIFMFIKVYKN